MQSIDRIHDGRRLGVHKVIVAGSQDKCVALNIHVDSIESVGLNQAGNRLNKVGNVLRSVDCHMPIGAAERKQYFLVLTMQCLYVCDELRLALNDGIDIKRDGARICRCSSKGHDNYVEICCNLGQRKIDRAIVKIVPVTDQETAIAPLSLIEGGYVYRGALRRRAGRVIRQNREGETCCRCQASDYKAGIGDRAYRSSCLKNRVTGHTTS